MNLNDYLKDKLFFLILYLINFILILFLLVVFNSNLVLIVMVLLLLVLSFLVYLIYDYNLKKRFYDEIYSIVDKNFNKLLVQEMIKPMFLESKILLDILRCINKYALEEINKFKHNQKDFEEFMTLWVHEVKLPLSAITLMCENNKNRITSSIMEESLKIQNYIDTILFYERSYNPEKDYLIKSVNLENIINKVIIKNKNNFIENKIKLEIHDLDVMVKTDSKWMEFIINQILSNSIKYISEAPIIEIYSVLNKNDVCLVIKDNGIGIDKDDLPRIFDKGFTGKNGRKKYNSTGIGLYLVKKLCNKLNNNVFVKSDNGTTVKIVFPINSYTNDIRGDE